MDEDDFIVTPAEGYDVDVQETIEQMAAERGLDLSFKEYEQPILQAYTRKKIDGQRNKFMFEMVGDRICTQEELEDEVAEFLDAMEESMENAGVEE